jgi:hypothetical protein
MKLEIDSPARLVDINAFPLRDIEETPEHGLRIGALVTNSALAADMKVRRKYPLLSQAILAGASWWAITGSTPCKPPSYVAMRCNVDIAHPARSRDLLTLLICASASLSSSCNGFTVHQFRRIRGACAPAPGIPAHEFWLLSRATLMARWAPTATLFSDWFANTL